MPSLIRRTAQISIATQLLIALITFSALFVEIPEDSKTDLQIILVLESASQVIEFFWYAIVLWRNKEIQTWSRYLDWFWSTPVMLLSTVLFFQHRKNESLASAFTLLLVICLMFNLVMLVSGFLMEVEKIPISLGLFLGSSFLVGSFSALATFVDPDDELSIYLFWIMYAVWSLYGVAAALPYVPKNIFYNLLDVISKNFYGLFLFVYILTL